MTIKKAIVIDTNFIIENKKRLKEVLDNLRKDHTVYVTQVSIEEIIAQRCRTIKTNFDEVEECAKKHGRIAKLTLLKTFEEECNHSQAAIRKWFRDLFGNNIIFYNKDEITLTIALDRAYKKLPPFPLHEKSDHGFKDTILWLSLINYFKNHGEDEIILVTDDKGFGKNHDILIEEFKKETTKTIKIVNNTYYNDLFQKDEPKPICSPTADLPEVSKLRDRISDVVSDLCIAEVTNEWGLKDLEKRFSISQKVDEAYIKVIFSNLHNDIKKHIFDKHVSVKAIFDLDDRFFDITYLIPMSKLEDAYRLHEEIKEKYPDYIEQFYSTVADIFNQNYIETVDDDLPFY